MGIHSATLSAILIQGLYAIHSYSNGGNHFLLASNISHYLGQNQALGQQRKSKKLLLSQGTVMVVVVKVLSS